MRTTHYSVALVTCSAYPQLTDDDRLLVPELEQPGIKAIPATGMIRPRRGAHRQTPWLGKERFYTIRETPARRRAESDLDEWIASIPQKAEADSEPSGQGRSERA